MISFLYRLVNGFESEHGFRPNMLYLSHNHYTKLRADLTNIQGLDELVLFLGMEIVIDGDMSHPQVAYSDINWRDVRAV